MDEQKRLSPIKAIRAKCLECSNGNNAEVRECVIPNCPLYPYRMGHNPYIKISDAHKAANIETLRKINDERRAKKSPCPDGE